MDQFRFVKRVNFTVGDNQDLVVVKPTGVYESGYEVQVKDLYFSGIDPTIVSGNKYIYDNPSEIGYVSLVYGGISAGKIILETGVGDYTNIDFI